MHECLLLWWMEPVLAEEFYHGPDPESVHALESGGELIRMASGLYDQRLPEQVYGKTGGDAEPQVVIFACRQRLVEKPDLCEQGPFQDHGGGADQTPLKGGFKDLAGMLQMFSSWIDPPSVSNPDFLCLTGMDPGKAPKEIHLERQLFRQPVIIRVQKSQIQARAGPDARIPRRGYTPIVAMYLAADPSGKDLQTNQGPISGAIVHNNHFIIFKRLKEYG